MFYMENRFDYVFYNGTYLLKSDFKISLNNRAFRYGDSLYETIHANGLSCQYLQSHYKRLVKGMAILGYKTDNNFTVDYLHKAIKGLLSRCKLFQGARVKVTVTRTDGGLFIPENSGYDVFIEAVYINSGNYQLNDNGLIIGIYNDYVKPVVDYMSIKTGSSLLYVLAGNYSRINAYNDVLLLNTNKFIVEATSSNVFFVKDKYLITPSINTGCVQGVMRSQIIRLAGNLGYSVAELDSIAPDELLNFDEVFLTNAIRGINWVGGFNNKRYYKKLSVKLISALNADAFN